MTEKPILFSTDLIREILAGRKTQTRRLIKKPALDAHGAMTPRRCPYGPVGTEGSRLWVREAHAIVPATAYASSTDDGVNPLPHRVSPDGSSWAVYFQNWTRCTPQRWRPSIHMPRWASRITLDVKSIHVERLQDISAENIIAEGFPRDDPRISDVTLRSRFAAAWDNLNGDRPGASWAENPLVWVINFKVHNAS